MSSGLIDRQVSASCSHGRRDSLKSDRSFLQALTGTNPSPKQENAAIYVHPLVKKSSAKLSDKSLEMCTESLGSETGCGDMTEETLIVGSDSSKAHPKENKSLAKTKKRSHDFPPPISSISDSVSMKYHRENGRLVMNAVHILDTSNSSLFLAERINGRLTLQLKIEEAEFEAEDENEIDETKVVKGGGETEDSVSLGEDMRGNSDNMEGNINISTDENISMAGRCNEAGGEIVERGHIWNVESCWVAS